jgi:hypothetical protein
LSDETFPVRLAGRSWELPHLSFRSIKAIQPALFRIYASAGGVEMSNSSIAALGEDDIEGLARATWRALSQVDPDLTLDAFMDLPFSVQDLLAAFPSVALAIGLRPADKLATSEASPGAGKSTSTP